MSIKAIVSVTPTGLTKTHEIDPDCGYGLDHFEARVDHKHDVDFSTGRITAGSAPLRLTELETVRANTSITIYADSSNTQSMWIGFTDSFTCDSDNVTDGFPLFPGASISIAIRNPRSIWISSEQTSQKAWWITV